MPTSRFGCRSRWKLERFTPRVQYEWSMSTIVRTCYMPGVAFKTKTVLTMYMTMLQTIIAASVPSVMMVIFRKTTKTFSVMKMALRMSLMKYNNRTKEKMRADYAAGYSLGDECDTTAPSPLTLPLETTLPSYLQVVAILHFVSIGVLQTAVVVVIRHDVGWIIMRMHPCKKAMMQGVQIMMNVVNYFWVVAVLQILKMEVFRLKKLVVMIRAMRLILMRIHTCQMTLIQSVWKLMIVINMIIREEANRGSVIVCFLRDIK